MTNSPMTNEFSPAKFGRGRENSVFCFYAPLPHFMYKVKLEQFVGPLNLLLQLIEAEDLDINQISLARVADDFINYVNANRDISPDELADFLLIASKLLYIKSKSLLPYLSWEEEEVNLEEQLKLYKEFREAAQKIEEIIKTKKFFWGRERRILPPGFYPPEKISAGLLSKVYQEVLKQIEPLVKTGKEIKEKIVSLKKKIEDLRSLIIRKAKMGFSEFIKSAKNKTEVIVSFLALLELVKQKVISTEQEEMFKDIIIRKN